MAEQYGFRADLAPSNYATCPSYPYRPQDLSYPPPPSDGCSTNDLPSPPYPTNNVFPTAPPLYPSLPPESSPCCNHSSSFRPIDPICERTKGYYWVDTHAFGGVPSTALHGGVDVDGEQIYVGRAYHDGDWIPAKVIPGKNVAYVSYGGEEHAKHQFQVLCEQRFDWLPSSNGYIPPGAVEGGRTCDGEVLYIGRVFHDGSQTVGKVHPSHHCCYIPFDGQELSYNDYEILVLRS